MKTPSSKQYIIVTGNQLFKQAAKHLEENRWGYVCNEVENSLKRVLITQGRHNSIGDLVFDKIRNQLIAMVHEYFRHPGLYEGQSVIWADDHDSRIIGAGLLAALCKEKQIKWYIPRPASV